MGRIVRNKTNSVEISGLHREMIHLRRENQTRQPAHTPIQVYLLIQSLDKV